MNIENVVNGLECCTERDKCDKKCRYWNSDKSCWINLKKDALALLKAQEPRVVAFEEIDNYEVLWLEVRDVQTEEGLAPWVKMKSGHWFSPLLCSDARPEMTLCTSDEYMRICRCWTSRPTDEQREATSWNE